MPTGNLHQRLDELRHMIGVRDGWVHGSVTVDQIYAHYQHEHREFHHPRGGKAGYLQDPLMRHFRQYLKDYADSLLHNGGIDSVKRSMEHLSDAVEIEAPREWGDLMRSGHPEVKLGERPVFDRPPKVHRLSEAELRIKSRAILRARLAAGLTVYFMRNGKVMRIPGKNEPHNLRGRL